MKKRPDNRGYFGAFGGRFVPETLMTALKELGEVYEAARNDPGYREELSRHLKEFAGRAQFLESGGDDDGGFDLFGDAIRDDLGHRGCRCHDDRELHPFGQ